VANTHARGYIEQISELKLSASKEASGWLEEHLAEQRKKVEASEIVFQQYREQNDGVSMEEKQNIVGQKLADISAAVTRAKTDRIEKESRYRQIAAIERDPTALDAFPAILSNLFIQQLKTQLADLQRQQALLSDQFGERHPDMIKITTAIQSAEAKLQVEIAKVVQGVRNDYLAAQAQELSLVGALEAQKREALAMNRKGIEGNVLKRDTESNRQLYDSLLQRTKETGVSGELKTNNVRLVDLAEVPRVPVSPNKSLNILLGFVSGILLAGGLVIFFEHLDDRIKTPDEVTTHLRLSTLGLVPRVAPKLLGPHPLISNGVPQNFAEAYRAVRTSVLFSPTDAGAKTIVVTSTGPGEGKTTTASNLAVGIAQTGERVLLIDTDMRRPQIHHMFDMEQEPGLSNLLIGNARSRQAIHASGVEGLWVLPAGHLPPNPAEMLASERFKHFLSALGEHFQWVVLDSPPVLAVDDASIVAHLAHGIVFVIGAEMTSRRAVATAIERLERVNGRFIGAVLNHVQVDRHSFYYSRYYRREYRDYYTRDNTRTSRLSHAPATALADAIENQMARKGITVSTNDLQAQ
jgi:capsular exopolysaccharide synthesis family protein